MFVERTVSEKQNNWPGVLAPVKEEDLGNDLTIVLCTIAIVLEIIASILMLIMVFKK